ncbi:MAG: hypothetical protein L0211_21215 [Planctomycetaceae bacterium]|nr:hypothetical protein [Planctomycetaceae bacterium]
MFSIVWDLLGCVSVPVFVLAFVGSVFRWTTGPILQAAANSNSPRSFLLTDLIWLLVQMQLAMGVASYAFPPGMLIRHRVAALILLCAATVLFWLASLHAVSRAGIKQPLRRAVVFVVLLPGLALTVLGVPLISVGLLHALGQQSEGQLPSHSPLAHGAQLVVLAAFALSLRWLARWTVAAC